jgi:opacity protein-like surface antigen
MKKFIAVFAFAAALVAGDANALRGELSPYISGKVGYAQSAIIGADYKHLYGFNLIAAGGVNYEVTRYFAIREELEASYSRGFGGNHSRYSPWTGMANMYFDFGNRVVRPYVGFGLGVAEVNYKTKILIVADPKEYAKVDFSNFAFNMGLYAGLNFDITKHLTGDLGFRYTRAELIHRDGDFQTFSGTLGLRYRF